MINKGGYIFSGGIYPQLAEITEFSDNDSEKIKQAILTMFENDASASRPNGSMTMAQLHWWKHGTKNGKYAPAKIFNSILVKPEKDFPYFSVSINDLPGLAPEIYRQI